MAWEDFSPGFAFATSDYGSNRFALDRRSGRLIVVRRAVGAEPDVDAVQALVGLTIHDPDSLLLEAGVRERFEGVRGGTLLRLADGFVARRYVSGISLSQLRRLLPDLPFRLGLRIALDAQTAIDRWARLMGSASARSSRVFVRWTGAVDVMPDQIEPPLEIGPDDIGPMPAHAAAELSHEAWRHRTSRPPPSPFAVMSLHAIGGPELFSRRGDTVWASEPPRCRERWPGAPPEIDALCARLSGLEPDFESHAELRAELERCLDCEGPAPTSADLGQYLVDHVADARVAEDVLLFLAWSELAPRPRRDEVRLRTPAVVPCSGFVACSELATTAQIVHELLDERVLPALSADVRYALQALRYSSLHARGVGPHLAAWFARRLGGRLPTAREWTELATAGIVDGAVWEWTSTPMETGWVVRGGPHRLAHGGPAESRGKPGHTSWEDTSAPDVGVRVVYDSAAEVRRRSPPG